MINEEKELLNQVAQKHGIKESALNKIIEIGKDAAYSEKTEKVRQAELLKDITYFYKKQ